MKDLKTFTQKDELALWLEENGIDMHTWGSGSAKTLDNLWDEYLEGEVVFNDDPPQRLVHVVQVIVRRGEFFLVETEQAFGNSQKRSRMLPPSEKFKFGEDRIAAAYRCLLEELGISLNQIKLIDSDWQIKENFSSSPSYPGLMTRYRVHTVAVQVAGLPEDDFWHDNRSYGDGDPIKSHKWSWRPFKEFKFST